MSFPPLDLDECESGEACWAQLCINYLGGYECSCQEGFRISSVACGCDGEFLSSNVKFLMWWGNQWRGNIWGRGLGWEREGFDTKETWISLWLNHVLLYELGCSEPQILISKVKTIMGLLGKLRKVINVKCLLLWLTSRNHSTKSSYYYYNNSHRPIIPFT